MASQSDLFGASLPPVAAHSDPATSHEGALLLHLSGRRGKQMQAILDRLLAGEATNVELCELAINYRARISDLRASGYRIECTRQRVNGLSTYVLRGTP